MFEFFVFGRGPPVPWLKVSDTTAMHPMILQASEYTESDDRVENELMGFLLRVYVSAAAYETDYVAHLGIVKKLGGPRWHDLTRLALKIGFFERFEFDDGRVGYKLYQDETNFMSMILRADREHRNAKARDSRNKDLTVPVRHRDGDECRWCGVIVQWNDRKSGRGGTYDHLSPGFAASSPDDLVVSCKSCNSSRRDNREGWDRRLRPAPENPYYGALTENFLRENHTLVKLSDALDVKIPEPTTPCEMVNPVESPNGRDISSDDSSPLVPVVGAVASAGTTLQLGGATSDVNSLSEVEIPGPPQADSSPLVPVVGAVASAGTTLQLGDGQSAASDHRFASWHPAAVSDSVAQGASGAGLREKSSGKSSFFTITNPDSSGRVGNEYIDSTPTRDNSNNHSHINNSLCSSSDSQVRKRNRRRKRGAYGL